MDQRLEHLRIASSAGIQAAHLALLDTLLAKDSSETSVSAEARKVISLLEVQDRGMHTLARGLLARLDKDYDAAAKLLRTEAARDSEYANLALGMMHDDTLIPENRSTLSKLKALRLYEAAANLGSIEALTRMGLLCERGLSDSGDYKLAVAYHRKAAEKGSHRSNYRLGVLLSEGSESSVTIPEAHARLSIAAAQGHETAKKKLEALENKLTKEQRLESSKLVQQIGLERFKRPTTSGIGRLVYTADTEGR
jgi:TPR repeat protein